MAKVSGQQPATVSPIESRLNTNALGLWGLVIMGIAYMGLALTGRPDGRPDGRALGTHRRAGQQCRSRRRHPVS